jgi:hypothetical protein
MHQETGELEKVHAGKPKEATAERMKSNKESKTEKDSPKKAHAEKPSHVKERSSSLDRHMADRMKRFKK